MVATVAAVAVAAMSVVVDASMVAAVAVVMAATVAVDLLIDWFGISCMTTDNFCFYLQNRLIQTSQTGGQRYSDTSPFSIPSLL